MGNGIVAFCGLRETVDGASGQIFGISRPNINTSHITANSEKSIPSRVMAPALLYIPNGRVYHHWPVVPRAEYNMYRIMHKPEISYGVVT